jgi:hypothetical protein
VKLSENIKKVLDRYANSQLNLSSDAAREQLAEEIKKSIEDRYLIFRKNELLVRDED